MLSGDELMFVRGLRLVRAARVSSSRSALIIDHGAEEVATCAATQWSQSTPNPHVFVQESRSADKELTPQRRVRVPRRVSLGMRLPRLQRARARTVHTARSMICARHFTAHFCVILVCSGLQTRARMIVQAACAAGSARIRPLRH